MAGEDEDVLLEIDRILAGEDEETQAAEAEPKTDDSEAEAEKDDGDEAPLPDFDLSGDEEEADETGDKPVATQNRINKTELISILFSRKTKLHFFLLVALLGIFFALSLSSGEWAVDLLLLLGYGASGGYLLTGILTRFGGVKELTRSDHPTSLLLPVLLSILIAGILWSIIGNANYGDNLRNGLRFGLVIIFIVWQFAQAWWMRVPFREYALRRVERKDGDSGQGGMLVYAAPIFWTLAGYMVFYLMARNYEPFAEDFNLMFQIFWFAMMISLALLTLFFLRRLQRDVSNAEATTFAGWFSVGYWGFLAYHAGVLLYSSSQEPSFVLDLIFMFITIVVAIYSLSVQVLRTESRRDHLSQTSHYIGEAEGMINRHNVIFIAISFTIAYGASNFFLTAGDRPLVGDPRSIGFVSHFIVLLSGVFVMLLANYNFLTGRGLLKKGFFEALRGR
jgi:hypothetical protein